MEVHFSKVSGDAVCQVRLSDESMKTNGLVLVEKFWATPKAYCLNPGYYYIGCIFANRNEKEQEAKSNTLHLNK